VKSLKVTLQSSTVLPALLSGGVVLGGALVFTSPIQAATPGIGKLNPPAISRTEARLLQVAAKMNPCNPCNPCAAKKNPCNPCAAKNTPRNPCAANPCGAASVDPKLVTRPKGTMLYSGNMASLVREGKKLFMDTSLSTNEMACQSCHANLDAFANSFAKAYPHKVAMAVDNSGINSVDLDEMIQFCMVVPMEAKPLPWGSRELAALTAYTASLQQSFIARGPNPCGASNPCNPCAAKKNPCNPCAAKNPCAAN